MAALIPPQAQVALAKRWGRVYDVDPRLLLAIGEHETQFGTLGAGRQGYTLGYGATDSGELSQYAGVGKQYEYGAKTLASWGVHNLSDVMAGKASRWATDPGWERGVQSAYKSLGSRYGTGVPASTPPSTLPGPRTVMRAQQVFDPLLFSQNLLALPPGQIMPLDLAQQSMRTVRSAVQLPGGPSLPTPPTRPVAPTSSTPASSGYPTMVQKAGKVPGYRGLFTDKQADASHVDTRILSMLSMWAQQTGNQVEILSGYRSPSYSAGVGGYANDPHTRGVAVDAYVTINGRRMPIGNAPGFFKWAQQHGLESGAQPGFYRGRSDPEHVQIPGSGVNKAIRARSYYG